MTATNETKLKSGVDLQAHHALCEMNYHKFMQLLPGIRQGIGEWCFSAGNADAPFRVKMSIVDAAPYTSTVEVEQKHSSLTSPRIVVRLYHDVNMAEIVSWDKHRHWLAQYHYPNAKMYHPDEKLALNQFLGDWLVFCRGNGLRDSESVIQFS